jgi:hypothetical protein
MCVQTFREKSNIFIVPCRVRRKNRVQSDGIQVSNRYSGQSPDRNPGAVVNTSDCNVVTICGCSKLTLAEGDAILLGMAYRTDSYPHVSLAQGEHAAGREGKHIRDSSGSDSGPTGFTERRIL